jgi:hypothetical protein
MSENEIVGRALRAGPECLPVEILDAHLQRGAEDAVRATAQAHLDQCPYCRTEIELLHNFESGVIRPDEAEAVRSITQSLAKKAGGKPARNSSVRWWSPRVMAGLGAAAVLIVVAAGLATQWHSRTWQGVPIPEFGEDKMRGQTMEIIPSANSFAWKAVPGAADYEITVRLVDGALVFHNFITKQTLAYPSEVVRTVNTGKLVLWEVVARDATGNQLARSAIQKIRH